MQWIHLVFCDYSRHYMDMSNGREVFTGPLPGMLFFQSQFTLETLAQPALALHEALRLPLMQKSW